MTAIIAILVGIAGLSYMLAPAAAPAADAGATHQGKNELARVERRNTLWAS